MFLEELKCQTASFHRALEKNPSSLALMSERVRLDDYQHYLERLFGFIHPFEIYICPLIEPFVDDLSKRIKSSFLIADLKHFGIDPGRLPVVPAMYLKKLFPTSWHALGGFYVVEGSTLGGMVIHQHLQSVFGKNVSDRVGYLTAYGKQTGSQWKLFLRQFSIHTKDIEVQKQVIEGAIACYSAIDEWMRN